MQPPRQQHGQDNSDNPPTTPQTSLVKKLQAIRRMDQLHIHLKHVIQGNFLAPLSNPAAILDVGCGNGRWVMETAIQYPSASVIGIDIVQPEPFVSLGHGLEQIPPNAGFIQGDILQGLSFPDAKLDFVFIRLMHDVIPAGAWEALLQEMFRITHPGGWIESLEFLPYAIQQGPAMTTIVGWLAGLLQQRGIEPRLALKIPQLLEAAGFEHITATEFSPSKQDSPGWEEVRKSHERSLALIEDLREPIVAAGIASKSEYEQTAAKARSELQYRANMSDFNIYDHFGQRPPVTLG